MTDIEINAHNLQILIDKQAEDEGLWFYPHFIGEDYLQKALRALHAVCEELLGEMETKDGN